MSLSHYEHCPLHTGCSFTYSRRHTQSEKTKKQILQIYNIYNYVHLCILLNNLNKGGWVGQTLYVKLSSCCFHECQTSNDNSNHEIHFPRSYKSTSLNFEPYFLYHVIVITCTSYQSHSRRLKSKQRTVINTFII